MRLTAAKGERVASSLAPPRRKIRGRLVARLGNQAGFCSVRVGFERLRRQVQGVRTWRKIKRRPSSARGAKSRANIADTVPISTANATAATPPDRTPIRAKPTRMNGDSYDCVVCIHSSNPTVQRTETISPKTAAPPAHDAAPVTTQSTSQRIDDFRFNNALPERMAIRSEPATAPIIGTNIGSTLDQSGLTSTSNLWSPFREEM